MKNYDLFTSTNFEVTHWGKNYFFSLKQESVHTFVMSRNDTTYVQLLYSLFKNMVW